VIDSDQPARRGFLAHGKVASMSFSLRSMALAAALAATAAGCSSSPAAPTDAGTDDGGGIVGCDDQRAQNYAPNMSVAGQAGIFTFVLVSSTPAPPANETNVFVLRILDASGQPVTDATFPNINPRMRTHGTAKVTATSNGDGTYTLQPVYLFMAGLWEIDITAQSGSATDSAAFFFCIAG
jgi:hypothetical protein